MIAKLFYFDLTKKILAKNLNIKDFERKPRHQVVEAEASKGGSGSDSKLSFPHPWF